MDITIDKLTLSEEEIWEMRLYVAGKSAKSLLAIANLQRICEEMGGTITSNRIQKR